MYGHHPFKNIIMVKSATDDLACLIKRCSISPLFNHYLCARALIKPYNCHLLFTQAGTTLFVCEGGTVNIRCPGAKIQIQQAGYGRSEENVCPHPMIQTTDCRAPRSKVIVKGMCEGRRQCHLTATNEAFEGDPCVNTYKYLRVKYICVD